MADLIDLHIHTDHSDGLQTPVQAVDACVALGLRAMAITDHDTVTGSIAAAAYAAGAIEVISGIELSSSFDEESDIHILAYFIDTGHARLTGTLDRFRQARLERGRKMVERLAGMGLAIDYDEVLELAGDATVGRPHLAEVLVRHRLVGSYAEAFGRYLYLGGPVYVPKAKLSPAEAVALVHEAGGMAVMAHPGLTNRDACIDELVAAGLDGIEVYHPTHDAGQRNRYRQVAARNNLAVTGGSDSHNRKGRFGDIGDEKVPLSCLDDLRARWDKRAGAKAKSGV